jgi:hypothetical protein
MNPHPPTPCISHHHKPTPISVAKGPKFRPKIPKGAAKKSELPEKLAAEFLPDFHEKGNLWIF